MNLILVGKILGVAGFLGGTFGLGMILRNQKSESTDENIYLYAVSSLTGTEDNAEDANAADSFRCQFGSEKPINCELSKLSDNEFKQHKIKDIQAKTMTTATNDDLSDFKAFFQIKFTGSENWNKLSSVTDEFKVFQKLQSGSSTPYKHIVFTAEVATHKDNTKIFRSAAFIVKALTAETFDRKDTDGTSKSFTCDFGQSEGNQPEDCYVKNFSTDTDVVDKKDYDKVAFDFTHGGSTDKIEAETYYLITLKTRKEINNLHKKQITLNTTDSTKIIFENLATAIVPKSHNHLLVL